MIPGPLLQGLLALSNFSLGVFCREGVPFSTPSLLRIRCMAWSFILGPDILALLLVALPASFWTPKIQTHLYYILAHFVLLTLISFFRKLKCKGQSDYAAIWRSMVREDEGENQKLLCISYGKWLCLNCTLLIPEVEPHGVHLGYQFVLLVLHAPPSLWLNNSLLVCTSVGQLLIFFLS
jgi:hypothetical protein